jgi:hypothetical protein
MRRRAEKWSRRLGAALFLLAAGRARAQGGPPLFTDDPGTPGSGNWEVNVAMTLDRTAFLSTWGTPLVDANYGWGERVQLKLEMPWVVESDDLGTRGGVGNPLFGVKWRFLDEDSAGIAVSTYPQFGFNLASSSADRGLVEREASFLLPVSAVKTVGPVPVAPSSTLLFSGGWSVAYGEGPRHTFVYLGLQLTSSRKGNP